MGMLGCTVRRLLRMGPAGEMRRREACRFECPRIIFLQYYAPGTTTAREIQQFLVTAWAVSTTPPRLPYIDCCCSTADGLIEWTSGRRIKFNSDPGGGDLPGRPGEQNLSTWAGAATDGLKQYSGRGPVGGGRAGISEEMGGSTWFR